MPANLASIMAEIQALQSEGLVLRYPDTFQHSQLNFDVVVNMLMRASQQAMTMPFVWSWLDRPQDGQVFLIYLAQPAFPPDGIRWQDAETKYSVGQGSPKELEVCEIKYGFVPGSGETNSTRMRRRYRMVHGGMPQLWLVHYSRVAGPPIPPALVTQPVRMYPLRQVTEPGMFVIGEKVGQKVYPPGGGPGPAMGGMGNIGMGGMQPGMGNMVGGPMGGMAGGPGYSQQAHLAQQNANMEMLEARRREREMAARGGPPGAGPGPRAPPPGAGQRPRGMEDDDSGDEMENISARTLALTRYKRNHDLMNEVFAQAAFGHKQVPAISSPYSNFDKKEVDEKVIKLSAEIEALKARAEERKLQKLEMKNHAMLELGEADVAIEGDSLPVPVMALDWDQAWD